MYGSNGAPFLSFLLQSGDLDLVGDPNKLILIAQFLNILIFGGDHITLHSQLLRLQRQLFDLLIQIVDLPLIKLLLILYVLLFGDI